jgi:hypothetical protein
MVTPTTQKWRGLTETRNDALMKVQLATREPIYLHLIPLPLLRILLKACCSVKAL